MRAFLSVVIILAAGLVIGARTCLAADPSAATDKGLLQAIVDDPRAVATLIGALAGFTLGVLIKFGFDLLLDWIRRRQSRRSLAAELHAEIGWFVSRLIKAAHSINELCPADVDDQSLVATTSVQWNQWRPPRLPVFDAHIGQLGLLHPTLTEGIVALGEHAEWMNDYIRTVIADANAREFDTALSVLRDLLGEHLKAVRLALGISPVLASVAKLDPINSAKFKAELDAMEAAVAKANEVTA